MGSTNSTTYYNLPQFIGSDKLTILGDVNNALSAIDTVLNTINTNLTTTTDKVTVNVNNISTLTNSLTSAQESITNINKNLENMVTTTDFDSLEERTETNEGNILANTNNISDLTRKNSLLANPITLSATRNCTYGNITSFVSYTASEKCSILLNTQINVPSMSTDFREIVRYYINGAETTDVSNPSYCDERWHYNTTVGLKWSTCGLVQLSAGDVLTVTYTHTSNNTISITANCLGIVLV